MTRLPGIRSTPAQIQQARKPAPAPRPVRRPAPRPPATEQEALTRCIRLARDRFIASEYAAFLHHYPNIERTTSQ